MRYIKLITHLLTNCTAHFVAEWRKSASAEMQRHDEHDYNWLTTVDTLSQAQLQLQEQRSLNWDFTVTTAWLDKANTGAVQVTLLHSGRVLFYCLVSFTRLEKF